MSGKIKVLIVDDSALIRKFLSKIVSMAQDMEVVAVAPDPYVAREKLVELRPDVMTLDVEMPRMDGISFLQKVMQHMPTRTLIVSSLAKEGSETALKALEAGAIDVIEKPSMDVTQTLESMAQSIQDKIRMAARARLLAPTVAPIKSIAKTGPAALSKTTHQILAVASSTGGTEALKVFLSGFSSDIPGTVVVQHMPPGFTKSFAQALNDGFPFEVKEAQEGDRVQPGRVLIAPGNFHMELTRSGAYYQVKLHQEPLLHGVRPAADYLMKSVAKIAGANAIGVILTGMGKDGAEGLLQMKQAGAHTYGQSERSCVVYGMPKAAHELGALIESADLDQLSGLVVRSWAQKAA
ncbi:MAG: chemotaxis response regulator protein-glutamate methylesterase [Pseudobdellovibrionaceae bacterium]